MLKKLCITILLTTGCQTVTIRPGGGAATHRAPDFKQTQGFFLWGLVPGQKFVNVEKICGGEAVEQMRTQDTFLNSFLSVITLGIYNPRTASVWCKKEDRNVADISDEVTI